MKLRTLFPFVFTTLIALCFASCFAMETRAAQNEIQTALQPYVDSGEMAGFVTIIASKEKILQVDAIGYADLETKTPMREDTLFWIASSSKPFAAAAVMILVDEGKLKLDDPIAKYLPEFHELKVAVKNDDGTILLRKPASPPTVRQCLAHTAGWPFLSPYMERYGIDSLGPRRAATSYAMMTLLDDPGKKFVYSNVGINITSAIVEVVSGQRFEDFMKSRIFDPLEMKQTTYVPSSEQLKNLATSYGYSNEKKELREIKINYLTYPLDDPHIRYAEAGGGMFSTAPEIVRFFQMLAGDGEFQGKRILSPEAVKEMRTNQTGEAGESYGLGMGLFGSVFGHGGAYGNDAVVHPDWGLVAIYMVQVSGVPKQGEAKESFNKAVQKMVIEGAWKQ